MFKDLMDTLMYGAISITEANCGRTISHHLKVRRKFRRAAIRYCDSIGLTTYSGGGKGLHVWVTSESELLAVQSYVHQLEFWASVPRPTPRERFLAFLQNLKSKFFSKEVT